MSDEKSQEHYTYKVYPDRNREMLILFLMKHEGFEN